MSELRQDRATGALVIIAPQRRLRPADSATQRRRSDSLPRFDPTCPFCPGHEAELPGIIAEAAADGAPGWSVRVVPNKFPALLPADSPAPAPPRHHARAGHGTHEVVIESPRHNADLAAMTTAERQAVVAMYRGRCTALLAEPAIKTVVLFRNRGPASGATLAHPHAQIIALGLVPPRMAAINETTLNYCRKEGRCAICDELEIELALRERIVEENAQFVALVPYAAEHPFELWIVPKRHHASFTAAGDAELQDFSELLGRSLQRIEAALQRPSYNFVIDTAPKSGISAPHLHWRLRIVPETVTWGGFELGTGLPINPSVPEEDAAVLRAVTLQRESQP